MWTSVLCYIKYKSNPGYKAIYKSAMPYLIALMITGLKFFENPENEQIYS